MQHKAIHTHTHFVLMTCICNSHQKTSKDPGWKQVATLPCIWRVILVAFVFRVYLQLLFTIQHRSHGAFQEPFACFMAYRSIVLVSAHVFPPHMLNSHILSCTHGSRARVSCSVRTLNPNDSTFTPIISFFIRASSCFFIVTIPWKNNVSGCISIPAAKTRFMIQQLSQTAGCTWNILFMLEF